MRVTIHCGSQLSMGHNRRDPKYTSKDGHIDTAKTHLNKTFERDLETRYQQIFGAAVAEYNASCKRADRKIQNLLSATQADKKKHPVYEMIAQIGSEQEHLPPEKAERILLKYAASWAKRNPQLALVGVYLHMDEVTPHLHIDYVPVARYERGLRLRPGLNRAMEQTMGHKSQGRTKTAQIAWQDREREYLRTLCQERGYVTEEVRHGRGVRHLETPAYREQARQELRQQREQLQSAAQLLQLREELLRQADPEAHRHYTAELEADEDGFRRDWQDLEDFFR